MIECILHNSNFPPQQLISYLDARTQKVLVGRMLSPLDEDKSKYQDLITDFLTRTTATLRNSYMGIDKFQDGFAFSCFEEVLQMYGQFYDPIDDELYPLKRKKRDQETRWLNAYKLSNEENWVYTEGLIVLEAKPLPLESAWLTDVKTENVIDPTFHGKGLAYFGVPFVKAFVTQHAMEANRIGIFQLV